MADIFLSYAREDREKAERLAKALEGQGWSVWWDTRLSAGDIWDELIERELHASRAVVVLWSGMSIKRRWVKREARYGDRKRMLFPAFIEAVEPPLEFSDVQAEDLVRWRGRASHSGYRSLTSALRAQLDPTERTPARAEQATSPKSETGRGAPSWEEDEKLNRRILIEGGQFLMGSPEGVGADDERPQHRVRLSLFFIQEHAVTNEEYRRFKPGHESPRHKKRHPVVNVSSTDASAYAEWLGGRLPTEAEWEYACRAGSETAYWNGDSEKDLARVAWYKENSGGHSHPVREKPANRWGLHDMHGNVWEWVADWYGPYPEDPQVDPLDTGSSSGRRVFRGGSFSVPAGNARSALRLRGVPGHRVGSLGFRVAFDAAPSEEKA